MKSEHWIGMEQEKKLFLAYLGLELRIKYLDQKADKRILLTNLNNNIIIENVFFLLLNYLMSS